MSPRRLLRTAGYTLAALAGAGPLLGTVALFGLIGWAASHRALSIARTDGQPGNVWDALFLAFVGPTGFDDLMLGLSWFLTHLLFLLAAGPCARRELDHLGNLVLPRVGSRATWWWGKVAALAAAASGYLFLATAAATLAAVVRLPPALSWSGIMQSGELWSMPPGLTVGQFALSALLLVWSTLLALAVAQVTLSLVLEHASQSFAIVTGVLALSWLLSGSPVAALRWWPGGQSLLLRHSFLHPATPGLGVSWSCGYNALWTVIWTVLGTRVVQRIDLHAAGET
jgi:hypothetical protein